MPNQEWFEKWTKIIERCPLCGKEDSNTKEHMEEFHPIKEVLIYEEIKQK